MAVEETQLPDSIVALLGLPDILLLQLSVDYIILTHQGCDWRLACPSPFWDNCLRFFGLRRRLATMLPAGIPVAPPLPELAPTRPPPPVPVVHDPPESSSNKVPPDRGFLLETKQMQREALGQRTQGMIGRLFHPTRRYSDSELLEEIRSSSFRDQAALSLSIPAT